MARPSASAPLRVLAWPGLGLRAKNPYTWLLYTHLAALGVRVRDFTPPRALLGGYDLLHLHWPEKALNAGSLPGRLAGAAAALAIIQAARLHRARVVWTAHNAHPHESRHPGLEQRYLASVVRKVDAVIHPSLAGQRSVEASYPRLAARPHAVVPLGHYRGSYPNELSRDEARAALGLSPAAQVVAFVGLVRPYKNVPLLIRTVRELARERPELTLLVGGAPLAPEVDREVRAAAGGDPRVRLTLEHLPEEDVQRFLVPADLVALPFMDITNSSSALLALTFDRPVLVPARGAMGELQAIVGSDWVRTYEGELTPRLLAEALDWARRPRPSPPPLEPLDWPEIARQTLALYRAALG